MLSEPIVGTGSEVYFDFLLPDEYGYLMLQFRRERRLALSVKYTNRLEAKKGRIQPEQPYKLDPLDDVFLTAPPLTAT